VTEVPEAPEAPEALEVPELPEATLQSLAFEEHPEPLEGQALNFGRTGVLPCRTVPFFVVSCCSVAYRSFPFNSHRVFPISCRSVPMTFMSASVPIFADVSCCLIVAHVDSCCSMLSRVVSCRSHVVLMLSHIAP
jgi:hypothetical protein